MFRFTSDLLRKKYPWRELLHPLPIKARQRQWIKRDMIEVNEEILRRPYYKLQSVDPSVQEKRNTLRAPDTNGPQLAEDTLPRDVRLLRHAHPESWGTIPPHSPSKYQ